MSGAFAARADAIFGALGNPDKANEWCLDTAQGFKPGADDALDRGSSDDEAEEHEPLPGADDSDEEQSYRLQASRCYRQAFEREEEEDEYDRVAAGTNADDSRPARSMEVLEDNVFDRMHNQSCGTAPTDAVAASPAPSNAAANDYQPMDLDDYGKPPPLHPLPGQHHQQQQERQLGSQQHRPQRPRRQTWVPPNQRLDYRRLDEAAEVTQQQGTAMPQHHQQQQHGRRVRFAEGSLGQPSAEASDDHHHQQQQQQQQQRMRVTSMGCGSGRGRRGQSFVPDHVQNPQKYTVYTLDEPLFVGQGDRDSGEMQAMQRGGGHRGDRGGSSSSSSKGSSGAQQGRSGESGSRILPRQADADVDNRGRWQGGDDEGPMLLHASSAAAAAVERDAETADEPVRELPPTGAIKFQPTSKRAKKGEPAAAGTAGDQQGTALLTGASGPTVAAHEVLTEGVDLEERMQLEEEPAAVSAAPSASVTRSKGTRQRHYRSKASDPTE